MGKSQVKTTSNSKALVSLQHFFIIQQSIYECLENHSSPQSPKKRSTVLGYPRGPSDGVALEAPIVAFGFLQHLPEGALPLTSLLRNDRKDVRSRKYKWLRMTAYDLFSGGVRHIGKCMQLQIVLQNAPETLFSKGLMTCLLTWRCCEAASGCQRSSFFSLIHRATWPKVRLMRWGCPILQEYLQKRSKTRYF